MRSIILAAVLAFGLLLPGSVQANPAKNRKAPAKNSAAKQESPEKIDAAFQTFCQDWMQKLAVREHDNIANIKWNTKSDGIEGEYVGYTQDHTCVVKNNDSAPVGKIAYQEVKYAKRGPTVDEAQKNPPHPVETTAVTELFRYDHGKWVY